MRIVLVLIIFVYGHVQCISKESCQTKCMLMYNSSDTIGEIHFEEKICGCYKKIATFPVEYMNNNDWYCYDKFFNSTGTFVLNSENYYLDGEHVFHCMISYDCDEELCEEYCSKEYSPEKFSSFCHSHSECRCKNETDVCIVSTNQEQSILEYRPQNNNMINDMLFNLKNLSDNLCPQVPVRNSKISFVNGTYVKDKSILYSYNECEVMCKVKTEYMEIPRNCDYEDFHCPPERLPIGKYVDCNSK